MDRREEALRMTVIEEEGLVEEVGEQQEVGIIGIAPAAYKESFTFHLEQTQKMIEVHAASCQAGQKLIYDYSEVVQATLKRFIEAGAEMN